MFGLLTDRVSILRANVTTNSIGERTESWAPVASSVPASIQPRSGNYRQREYGREVESTHVAFLGAGADLVAGDRLELSGTRYLVTFVAVHRNHHIEADLSQVRE